VGDTMSVKKYKRRFRKWKAKVFGDKPERR